MNGKLQLHVYQNTIVHVHVNVKIIICRFCVPYLSVRDSGVPMFGYILNKELFLKTELPVPSQIRIENI